MKRANILRQRCSARARGPAWEGLGWAAWWLADEELTIRARQSYAVLTAVWMVGMEAVQTVWAVVPLAGMGYLIGGLGRGVKNS